MSTKVHKRLAPGCAGSRCNSSGNYRKRLVLTDDWNKVTCAKCRSHRGVEVADSRDPAAAGDGNSHTQASGRVDHGAHPETLGFRVQPIPSNATFS